MKGVCDFVEQFLSPLIFVNYSFIQPTNIHWAHWLCIGLKVTRAISAAMSFWNAAISHLFCFSAFSDPLSTLCLHPVNSPLPQLTRFHFCC